MVVVVVAETSTENNGNMGKYITVCWLIQINLTILNGNDSGYLLTFTQQSVYFVDYFVPFPRVCNSNVSSTSLSRMA